jgi:cell division protein FtsI/penicillin-binding protein 2/cell division protein FtsW (lipid II flippase)
VLTLEEAGTRHRPAPPAQRLGGWEIDWPAVLAVAALVGLGELNLLAIGGGGLAVHQLLSVIGGLALLCLLLRVRAASLPLLGTMMYALTVLLLLAVTFKGRGAYGAQRWFSLGIFDLQPSELAKLGLLLLLATLLGGGRAGWERAAAALAAAAVPIGLTLLQPDLSTASVLAALALAMLVVARAPVPMLAGLVGAAAAVAPLAVRFLRPYQVARLHAFLSGTSSSSGPGWALLQAHIAVAWGGLFGRFQDPLHLLLATYLPARQTDLAFASLVEQWGLVGGAAAVVAVVVLVWRLTSASRRARTRSGALVAAGLAVLLGVETVVSVGGNLGVLPMAGVPFPFVSYGGTVAAVHLAALGLALAGPREARRRRLWMPARWALRQPRLVRLAGLGIAMQLVGLSLLAWHLQQASGPELRSVGTVQMSRCVRLPASRGIIADRHGTPVAVDAPEDQVLAVPGLVVSRPATARRLSALTGVAPAELHRLLRQPADGPAVRVATVPSTVGAQLQAADLTGVMVTQSPRRAYPYGPLLGPLLGFTGVASPEDMAARPDLALGSYVGKAGLERQYDALLRGIDGSQCFSVDPLGRPVAAAQHTPPVPGANLQLSLDLGMQEAATGALADALRGVPGQPRGDQGAVVVMSAQTGDLLALASLPAYDDNAFGPPADLAAVRQAAGAPGDPMLEHAAQDAVPPGSTFKLVVGAADTVFGAIPVGQVIPTGYTFTLGDHTYHGWGTLPPQDLTQAIGWSNDVYFYKLALALGPDRIHQVGSQLGVGQRTGIDLPDESAGLLGTPESVQRMGETWYPGTSVILGIGQGYVTVTPLQNARWTAAVTTGQLVTPHLGLAFQPGGSAAMALPGPVPVALPFAGGLGPVRDGMRLAVTQGTATLLRDVQMPVGGKTGTAEDPSTPSGGEDAWFTSVAPIDHPEIVVTVLVRGGGEGGLTSAPVADRLLRLYAAGRDAILAAAPYAPLTAPAP